MRKLYLLLLLLIASVTYGQQPFEVKGIIADTAGKALPGVSVKLLHGKDSAQMLTDAAGAYTFGNIITPSFTITATYSGLEPFSQSFTKTSTNPVFRVTPILMAPYTGQMEGIIISTTKAVIVKEDTVQYDVGSYKVREGAPIEDVIKKLPGVTVDKDGNIEAQGKKVARVRVNGKDFFGGDVQTATQNLPADIIDNIQIIDDYGDQANISGIKSGEPEKVININTQRNKNRGSFGTATLAGGNEGRYAGNVFVNNFRDDRQISLLGSINNTNANLFNFNGGGRGGGARGANLGSEGRSGPGGNGITLAKSIGLNFRDKWGEKISVYGSYSFSSRSTHITSSSISQDIDPSKNRITDREGGNNSISTNHRLTWNFEYAMDSFNFLKLSPYFSYSNSDNESKSRSKIMRGEFYTLSDNLGSSNSHSPSGGGNALFNHRFKKRGRNFSANFTVDYSDNNNDRYSNNHNIDSTNAVGITKDTVQIQDILTQSKNTRTNAQFSYSEPLNAAGTTLIELIYNWNKSSTESIKEVNDLQDSAGKLAVYNEDQSNHYNYTFITNRAGISLKGRGEKYNYSIGLQAQPSSLSGNSVGKATGTTSYTNINWIPSTRFVYNFARNNTLTATLDGNAREPSFFQLQPVVDSSNLNNTIVGNPNLQNEFTHTVALRYNKFDSKAGTSLFINVSYDRTSDKIVSNRYNKPTGTGRVTSYLNTDGFEGYNGNASYTKPFANRKYTASINMAASYDNNISYTDNYKNNGSNWNLRPGVSFRLDLENKVDLTLRGDFTAYKTTINYSKDSTTQTTKAQTLNLGLNGKNFFGDFTVGYDFSQVINYGFVGSAITNPTILNLYTEYRFLKGKMLTVRFQGFDLFNQSAGITHTITETTITDSRVLKLGRYFLLSANIRLAKFAGGVTRQRMQGEGGQQNRQGGGNRNGGGPRF